MSSLNHSSIRKSKNSKSSKQHTHEEVTHQAVAETASAHASPLDALAGATVAALDSLESKLDLDTVVAPNDAAQMHALKRVSAEAIGTAASIVLAAPSQYPQFDGGELRQSADYVRAMTRVAERVATLLQHVQNSLLNRRSKASQATLVLYGAVKELGRVKGNQAMRENAAQLAGQLKMARKKRLTTQQKNELRAAKQKARLVAKLEAKLAQAKGTANLPNPTPDASTGNAASAAGSRAPSAQAPAPEVVMTINPKPQPPTALN